MTGNDALLAVQEVAQLMARLRGPHGCPWDKAQTWRSLIPYTIEEAYEVAEAVETGDVPGLQDELGDLLFHVAFYSQIAQEAGYFSLDDVARGVVTKMTRRHPHVFGPHAERLANAHEVSDRWEEMKRHERQQQQQQQKTQGEERPVSVLDGVESRLPALLWADKVQRKMGQVGFDWEDAEGVEEKLREEMAELAQARCAQNADAVEEELGDVLFTMVNLARHIGINPEMALRRATRKMQARFRSMEARLVEAGETVDSVDLARLESLWQEVKRAPAASRHGYRPRPPEI